MQKYKVITLCGDSKYKDRFIKEEKRLTLEGNVVLAPHLFEDDMDGDEDFILKTKQMLFEMQKQRIDISDMIFVININGEMNEDTKRLISYAKSKAKGVRYLDDSLIDTNDYEIDKFSTIIDLSISRRLMNILQRNHIDYLYQIENYSEERILKFRNMGIQTLEELRSVCNRYGVHIYSRADMEVSGHFIHFSANQYETLFAAGIKTKEDVVRMKDEALGALFGKNSVIYEKLMQIKRCYKKQ